MGNSFIDASAAGNMDELTQYNVKSILYKGSILNAALVFKPI